MADAITVSGPISGTDRTLSFSTGKLAGQADGAVVARIGDTIVLATATAARKVREGTDFFPLTVDIEERMYAAGKIPGSFFRREGRATDQAILTARLIDRPLRPSFPEGFRNEVHVVGTILGADQTNPHDVLSINAASAALMISGIPFEGPIGAVRIAYSTEGTWLPHATYQEGDASTFELVVAGRALSEEPGADVAIVMVEAGGTERAFEYFADGAPPVTEEVIANGLEVAKTWIRESIELQRQLVREAGSKPTIEFTLFVDYGEDVYERVVAVGSERLRSANAITAKAERSGALDAATDAIIEELSPEFPDREREIRAAARSHTKKIVRKRIVEEGIRIDGRGPADIRPLSAEVGLLPTAHGSALFQRGDTQVLNVCTLGMPRMNQLLDTIGIDETKRYMHHYNFPPFSTGETGFMRGPKRREIGHGLLAERALLPVVPPETEFPYVLRLVSDVLSSNGSTSMASVCGSSLSLMDAGVPIKAPVGGIAMGLVFAEGKYTTLTDILGAEDAFGDMDFKVAGTADIVTALQLDTKIAGIPAEVLAQALSQACDAQAQGPRGHGVGDLGSSLGSRGERAEDRQLRDPDRQDRRGHRPEGQGDQCDPAGDRRGRERRRRRSGGHGHHRRQAALGGRRGPPPHRADPRPADARGGRRLHGQGREHHQVRGLREHPSRARRPGPHLEARAGTQGRTRRGRRHPRPGGRGPRRRDRPAGQGLAVARGRRAGRRPGSFVSGRGRQRGRTAVATAAGARPARAGPRRPQTAEARRRPGRAGGPRSRTPSPTELESTFGDLGPADLAAGRRRRWPASQHRQRRRCPPWSWGRVGLSPASPEERGTLS